MTPETEESRQRVPDSETTKFRYSSERPLETPSGTVRYGDDTRINPFQLFDPGLVQVETGSDTVTRSMEV